MWASDEPGIRVSVFKSQCFHKVVIFVREPLKVFHWHKRLFGFISMPSCHPIASLWPQCKLWHLDPRGGRIWPIYRTVSNVPVWIYRILTCFEAKALPYSVLKGVFFFSLFLLYLQSAHSLFFFQTTTAKVAALRRTVVNKQNQNHIGRGFFFFGGSPPQNFFGLVTARSSKPSQGGALCRRQEPVAWSARAEGGGHWRGGRVRGRRGKGTFAVQLAALCEAVTVGPYREESENEAFSSLVAPPPLVSFSPHSVHWVHSLFLSLFSINSSFPSLCCLFCKRKATHFTINIPYSFLSSPSDW